MKEEGGFTRLKLQANVKPPFLLSPDVESPHTEPIEPAAPAGLYVMPCYELLQPFFIDRDRGLIHNTIHTKQI
ncbi:hypothetical protein C2I18_20340 [Paenibacillus sp. PK3_47]|nr:hypothetical protein C2I18_20340 [Paenibacillus sp. PK3_47]